MRRIKGRALRPKGKALILALASCLLTFLAAHALAGGGFDRGFSGDGKRVTDLGGSEDLSAVETIGNRKIVVAGHTDLFGDDDFSVTRYRRSGALDQDFAAGGHAIADFDGDDDRHTTWRSTPRNGWSRSASRTSEPPPTLPSRGSGPAAGSIRASRATARPASTSARPTCGSGVAIQRNGKIVISVRTTSGLSDHDLAVLRLKPGGTAGSQLRWGPWCGQTDFGGNELASDVVLKGRKIVVAGSADDGVDTDFAVARYRAGGGLDRSILGRRQAVDRLRGRRLRLVPGYRAKGPAADRGRRRSRLRLGTRPPASWWRPRRDVLRRWPQDHRPGWGVRHADRGRRRRQADPRRRRDQHQRESSLRVARYRSGGGLDGSFAGDGIKSFTISPGAQSEGARDLAVQRDGRIVAAGFSFEPGSGDQAIVRLRP